MMPDELFEFVMTHLRTMSAKQREEFFSSVRQNGVFCDYCGYEEPQGDIRGCQCQNDE